MRYPIEYGDCIFVTKRGRIHHMAPNWHYETTPEWVKRQPVLDRLKMLVRYRSWHPLIPQIEDGMAKATRFIAEMEMRP